MRFSQAGSLLALAFFAACVSHRTVESGDASEHVTVALTPPRTGLIYDDIYLKHDTGAGHPERAERLVAIRKRLERTGLLSQLALIKPRAASVESLATVHTPQYIDHIRQICRAGTGSVDSSDTAASRDSYDVALMAAGGVQSAIDAIMEGRINNAFCASSIH